MVSITAFNKVLVSHFGLTLPISTKSIIKPASASDGDGLMNSNESDVLKCECITVASIPILRYVRKERVHL